MTPPRPTLRRGDHRSVQRDHAGDAARNYVIVRTFTATDDAGNSVSATQTITVKTPPLLSSPSSLPTSRQCSDEMPMDDATASDNCGEVTIEVSGETTAGDAAGNYVIVRTFLQRTMQTVSATQTITVKTRLLLSSPSSLPTPSSARMRCRWTMPRRPTTAAR